MMPIKEVMEAASLEQASACDGEYDLKRTGDFLKWIGQDVKKKSVAELEASGLEWKQVAKAVASKARNWYIKKAKTL